MIGGTLSAATYVVPTDEAMIGRADAIVIARALHSRVRESKTTGIETVYTFAVDETLKSDGAVASGFRVRVPGGTIAETGKPARLKIVHGAPRFKAAERVLLFLVRRGSGDYFVADLALGAFGFFTDAEGRMIISRSTPDIHGWTLSGDPHREPRRDSEKFLRFIREVAQKRPAANNYTIEPSGSSDAPQNGRLREQLMECVSCGARQYSSASPEAGDGFRWKTFPVSWNQGSGASRAGNDGADAINNAFNAWKTGSTVNYVLSSSVALTNGIYEGPDNVNNIVFEKNMYAHGVLRYSCAYGGTLGVAGAQLTVEDETNVIDSSLFYRTVEADVSMNEGVNECIGVTFGSAFFNTAVSHEVGHTLGFRHSDRSRDDSLPCTDYATYDCASSAVMTQSVDGTHDGLLAAWDQRAVAAIYPPGSSIYPPTNVVATATSSSSVNVTWSASSGAVSYQVWRSAGSGVWTLAGTPTTTSFTDGGLSEGSYLYRVRAVATGGYLSSDSGPDYATAFEFADSPLVAGMTARTLHVLQLRMAVNHLRTLAGLGDYPFTDPSFTAGITPIKAVHLNELRTAFSEARNALGFMPIGYSESIVAGVTPVKAAHINQLRSGVQ